MSLSFTDSHCHLNFEPLRQKLNSVLENAHASGVGHMLCVGVNIEKLPEILEIAHHHANVYASVGVHPDEQSGQDPSETDLIRLAQDSRIVAIGETGLDYYRLKGDMTWQQDRFRRHIRAARHCNKPLIIHTREAAADTLRIMREEQADQVTGVMHCFTESWETARAALDLGFYISFSGILTFKNANDLRDVARRVPLDRLLIETDAPYLAPVPHRGHVNEPAYVKHVAQLLAQLREMEVEAVAEITTRNFFNLFTQAVPVAPIDTHQIFA